MKYIIEEEDLKTLLIMARTLDALASGGVDDWEWYGDSIKDYEAEFGDIQNVDEMLEELEKFEE